MVTLNPTQEQISEAQAIVERCCGDNRLDAETQCAAAGIDPDVINGAINELMKGLDPKRERILALNPGIAVMLGVTLAATYLTPDN